MLPQSYEEKLTYLISTLVNWVDHEMPEALVYGNMPLKESLERYFYFSAVQEPSQLNMLLLAASRWRLSTPRSFLTDFYDEMSSINNQGLWLARSKAILKTFLRMCKFMCTRKRLQATTKQLPQIGLFAINARFVRFFAEYANELGKEKVLFFCVNAEAAEVASSLGFPVAMETPENIDTRKIKLSLLHPLFPAYWVTLQSYLRVHGTITKYRPATIAFAEGTSMQDQIAGWVARLENIPTVRLQSGRGGILHSGYRNMAFDKMLCWGNGFVERYRQYTPNAEYIITGSPLIPASTDRKIFDANRVTCVIFTQPMNKYLSRTHYEELEALAKQLLSEYKGLHLLIRKHPVDRCEILDLLSKDYPDRITVADYRTWSLKRVMEAADIAIGFYSTTLSESAACGVIPVILKLEDAHSVFPFPEKFGAAIEISSINDAIETVDSLLKNPTKQMEIRENMSRFANDFFGPQDGKAMERTVTHLLQTAGLN